VSHERTEQQQQQQQQCVVNMTMELYSQGTSCLNFLTICGIVTLSGRVLNHTLLYIEVKPALQLYEKKTVCHWETSTE